MVNQTIYEKCSTDASDDGCPKKYGYGIRHVQMACMFLCMTALFIARGSFGVAILAMTDSTRRNDTNIEIFDWDKKTQGLILSSFFWGYMVMQIPAGLLAKKYGGKPILLVALLANGVITLIMPVMAGLGGWPCVCACRMTMGLTQACLFPGSHTLLGRWLPASEMTALSGIVYGGYQIGTIIAMPVSGLLAETALGWKMIFYSISGLMFVTAAVWCGFAASSPAEHRLITAEERDYIQTALNTTSNVDRPIPWKHIFRTVPLYGILVAQIAAIIAFILFFVDLPTYLERAMGLSLRSSALLSGMPYAGMWVGGLLSTSICQQVYNRGILSLGACRKIFTSIAFIGTASGLVILSFLGTDRQYLAVCTIVGTFTLLGFISSGFTVNHLDLSPHFAGVMCSLTNVVASFLSVLTPIVTSFILNNDPSDMSRWQLVFLLAAAILVVCNIVYVLIGGADRRPWDNPDLHKLQIELEYGYGIRHLQMACMWFTMCALFIARSSLGVAILAMTDSTRRNDTNIEVYDWDKKTQGLILSSFFWGYMVMQIPAGLLAKKYGGKLILLVALLASGVILLITPIGASLGGWACVCACRVGMGLTQACLYPACHTLLGRWLPASERTALAGIVYGGFQIGTIVSMPISGMLAETALGWKMIFYSISGLMFVTAAVWCGFAASSPAEHRLITAEERDYIQTALNSTPANADRPIPWKHMLRTVPLYAIMVSHIASSIAVLMFFVDLPTYLEHAMQISFKNSAILSALPYAGMWFGGLFATSVSEKLYNKGFLSAVACRKIFNSIGLFGSAGGMAVLAFISPDHKHLAVCTLIVTLTLQGFMSGGFMVNHLDLSPHFAGVMLSLTNFVATLIGMLTPVTTSFILNNDPSDVSRWRIVFLLVAGILVLGNMLYIIFGNSDRQAWDDPDYDDKLKAELEEIKPALTEKEEVKK